MLRKPFIVALAAFAALVFAAGRASASGEGQADLDKATDKKVSAETLADLEEVSTLCESALKKGLDDENAKFARQLLTATLYEHASRLASAIFDRDPPSPQWPAIRQLALRSLERSLTFDDLEYASTYNTYVQTGLPPGPIANPGIDSITAVIRPAQTNFLFFVATGDGGHVFSETFEEHLANVEKYQP